MPLSREPGSKSSRYRVRAASAVAAPLLFVALLEAGLRIAGIGAPLPVLLRSIRGDDGEPQWAIRAPRTAALGRRQLNPQTLPGRKTADERRILVLGGSLVYGWPYDDRLSFPRLLEVGLRAIDSRDWRVVNLGAPGWGSGTLRAAAEQFLPLEPDLVLIVTGNNELLDEYSKGGLYRRSHLVRALASALRPLAERLRENRNVAIPALSDEQRGQLVAAHATNLAALVDTFSRAGAHVYLGTIPVNLRGCRPFAQDAPGEALGSSDRLLSRRYRRALELVASGDAASARSRLEALTRQLPGSARVRFLSARALDALNEVDAARRAYHEARDLDRVPLRSFGALDANAARVAHDARAGLVDLAQAIAVESSGIAPGDDLFLDSAHPNRRGTQLLARAVARALANDGRLATAPAPDWESRFDAALQAYLVQLDVPPELQRSALQFLTLYYTEFDPESERAQEVSAALDALPPLPAH